MFSKVAYIKKPLIQTITWIHLFCDGHVLIFFLIFNCLDGVTIHNYRNIIIILNII